MFTHGVKCFLGLLRQHAGGNICGELLEDVVEELQVGGRVVRGQDMIDVPSSVYHGLSIFKLCEMIDAYHVPTLSLALLKHEINMTKYPS